MTRDIATGEPPTSPSEKSPSDSSPSISTINSSPVITSPSTSTLKSDGTSISESQKPPTLPSSVYDTDDYDFQNDYIDGLPPPDPQQPPSPPSNRFPQVIVSPVSPGFPVYQDPRGGPARGNGRGSNGAGLGDFQKLPSPPVVSVGTVTVRAEEIGLVLVVLMLWVGAITLFINRWGKLRMLEPYQPAYTAPSPPPRPPPPVVGPCINIQSCHFSQSTSDLTLTEAGAAGGRHEWGSPGTYGRGSLASDYLGIPRSPSSLSIRTLDPQRKVKSAVDLVSLVMQEKMTSNVHFAATKV